MSVKISAKVWEWSRAEGTDRLVMLALSDFCDDDGACFPGIGRIAKKCRVSERTVQRSISALESMGELRIDRGCGVTTKTGPTNRFTLIFTRGDNLTPGDKQGAEGVTTEARRGDTAMSPKPSGESSVKPSGSERGSQRQVSNEEKKRFIPPSKQEVEAYFAEHGMNGRASIEAEKFINHHEARNWMMSRGVKMSKWRSAAATWQTNAADFAARFSPPVTGKPDQGEYLKEWPTWLKSKGHRFTEYQFAADFLKSDFHRERKAQKATK